MENIKKKIASLKEEVAAKELLVHELEQKLQDERECKEEEIIKHEDLKKKCDICENSLDEVEENLNRAVSKLQGFQEEDEEKHRLVQKLINDEMKTSDKLVYQHKELKNAKDIAEESDAKYEELARQLVKMESDLEITEDEADKEEKLNKDLNFEINELTAVLKSYQAMQKKFETKNEKQVQNIFELQQQYEECELGRNKAEALLKKLEVDLQKSELELDNAEVQRDAVKREYDETLQEISDLTV